MKTRQILISRYRKQSLLALCKLKEIRKFIIFVVMVGFIVGIVVAHFEGLSRNRSA